MVVLVALVISLILVFSFNAAKKEKINRVEEMKRKYISFNSKFGYVGNVSNLSWERLRAISEVSDAEMEKSDELFRAKLEEEKKQKEIKDNYERIRRAYPNACISYKIQHPYAQPSDFVRDEAEIKKAYEEALERTKRRLEEVNNGYVRLQKEYPYGFRSYQKKHLSAKKEDFINNKAEIIRLDDIGRKYEHVTTWSERQKVFSSKSRSLSIESWGCYFYTIKLKDVDELGRIIVYPFKVWQHYRLGYCLDTTLDYSNFSKVVRSGKTREKILLGESYFKASVYDSILNLIHELSDNAIVLFSGSGHSPMALTNTTSLNFIHFSYLRDELDKRGIKHWELGCETISVEEKQDIVIIEVDTSNTRLESNCKELFNTYRDKQPCITYISLLKEFSSDEMSSIIADYNKDLKEREAKRIAEQERQKQEEERKQREAAEKQRITASLKSAVSSWGNVPYSFIHHDFLIRYYPTTCDFDATDSEWNDRQLIWSFKNDPHKSTRIPHQQALNVLIPRVINKLNNTFGNLLSNLTLVCIPASSPEKNRARYEEFSRQLCERTGMTNAYSHLSVNGERVARHVGGEVGGTDSISFDEEFFKDKNILLFDDILTGGGSMRRFSSKLTSLGANVIAGLTLGKTFHTREEDVTSGVLNDSVGGITPNPPLPTPPYYSNDDDLPF